MRFPQVIDPALVVAVAVKITTVQLLARLGTFIAATPHLAQSVCSTGLCILSHGMFLRRKDSSSSDVLKLAVVIPTLNEAANIQSAVRSVAQQPGVKEVIVVDGGSTDRTVAIARACGAKVIRSPPGRGKQLNAGWRASRKAEWCLFLHADTKLPAGFAGLMAQAVAARQTKQCQQPPQQHCGLHLLQLHCLQRWWQQHQQGQGQQQHLSEHQQCQQVEQQQARAETSAQAACWGCFSTIQLTEVPRWQSWLVQTGVALRTRLCNMPYGDQALFVRKSALQTLHGFQEWKLLEDLDMIEKLRQLSPPAIVDVPVTTSGRLYKAAGFWEVVAAHQRILLAYNAHVHPDHLAGIRSQLLSKQQGSRGWPFS